MSSTKEKILRSALALFNAHGFAFVTMRMIAIEAGMSVGNLNYHYKKKEVLLEELYFEMVEKFDQRVEELPNVQIDFKYVIDQVSISLIRMIEYRFIWQELFSFLKTTPSIESHFREADTKRKAGYAFLFQFFISTGMMAKESFPSEYSLLANRMISYSNSWLYLVQISSDNDLDYDIKYHAKQLLMMMYPYLTSKGKNELLTQLELNP